MDSGSEAGDGGIFLFAKSTAKIKEAEVANSAEHGWPARLKKRPLLPRPTEQDLKAVVVTADEIRKGALRMVPTEADYHVVMGRKPKRRHRRISRRLRNLKQQAKVEKQAIEAAR